MGGPKSWKFCKNGAHEHSAEMASQLSARPGKLGKAAANCAREGEVVRSRTFLNCPKLKSCHQKAWCKRVLLVVHRIMATVPPENHARLQPGACKPKCGRKVPCSIHGQLRERQNLGMHASCFIMPLFDPSAGIYML